MDIGKSLKDLRSINNLTLEELASRSELTKGFLSQVERNLASPSISTLEDILEALGSDCASFFQKNKQDKIVFTKADAFVDEHDEYRIHWIVPNAQKNTMEPMQLEIFKDGSSQEVMPHNGEEFGYILAGEIMLCYQDKVYELKKDDVFYFKGKEKHIIKNNGKKIAKVLWICTPPIF